MDTIMKKILSIIAMGVALSFTVSCDLSEYNPNEANREQAFSNEAKVQTALNTLFIENLPKIAATYNGDGGGTADYVTVQTGLADRFRSGYNANSEDTWMTGDFEELRNIHYFLESMEDVCPLADDVKRNYIGQARFVRAFWYAQRLMTYGDLPWIDHVLLTEELNLIYQDRVSRDKIIGYIFDDLDYAIANITSVSSDKTTPDVYAAAFLKMRIALYEASFRKYNNVTASVTGEPFSRTVQDLYVIAAAEAERIMKGGKYALTNDYRAVFTSEALTDEVILGAATSSFVMGSQNQYYNNQNYRSLVRSFINTYLTKAGEPYTSTTGYASALFADEFTDRDSRLAKTVRYPGYKFAANSKADPVAAAPGIANNSAPLGYQIIKFSKDYALDGSHDQAGGNNTNSGPIFRYAEVLLALAEAKAELGTITDADWANTVGALRKRAGITGGTPATGTLTALPSGSPDAYLKANFYPNVDNAVIMEIRRERAIELVMEGQRMNDLIRWGCGKSLQDLEWTGINVAALNQALDLDGDGTNDLYLSTGEVPAAYKEIGIQVGSGSANGLNAVANGNVYQLKYIAERYWANDNHLILDFIPNPVIGQYKAKGYTLTQNPGY